MIGLYFEVWNELPLKLKFVFCAVSIFFVGACASPISLVSSIIFSFDQQKGCELQFIEDMKAVGMHTAHEQGSALNTARKNWSECPVQPSLAGQYQAIKEGRSIIFRN